MKHLIFTFLGIIISNLAYAQVSQITKLEKKKACQAMIENFDYDTNVSLSLCVSGRWNVDDVEENDQKRQVAFGWIGKISYDQGREDKCTGYILRNKTARARNDIRIIDLKCE